MKNVLKIPLEKLWIDDQLIEATRKRYLNKQDNKTILQQQNFGFVVADVGLPLQWIDTSTCYDFWKRHQGNIADDLDKIYLDDFPNSYAFIASEWSTVDQKTIIVLEIMH